eukprot:8850625-Lingulodinium_polyedra.AAC.1
MKTLGALQEGDPPLVRLSHERYWRFHHCLGWLLRTGRPLRPRELERLAGRYAFAALTRREGL